jgi:hypothetical protein
MYWTIGRHSLEDSNPQGHRRENFKFHFSIFTGWLAGPKLLIDEKKNGNIAQIFFALFDDVLSTEHVTKLKK